MKIQAIEKFPNENTFNEIINIDFNVEKLMTTVQFDEFSLDVLFHGPIGFRVLDEGDLLEFWPMCSSNNGWLYQILNDGWFDQESKRKGFLSSNNDEIKEFFIIGTNYCLNVLAYDPPTVEESSGVTKDY